MYDKSFLFLIILSYYRIETTGYLLLGEGIVGGDIAEEGQLKYQVSVQVNHKPKCGGGIVDKRFIVSAAHCIADQDTGKVITGNLTVVSANNVLDLYALRYEVEKIYFPAIFTESSMYIQNTVCYEEGDISVLKTKYELSLGENSILKKLELHDENADFFYGTFIIAGHGCNNVSYKIDIDTGRLMYTYEERDGRLRFAKVESLSTDHCNQLHSLTVHESNICAKMVQNDSKRPQGVCVGDSGSPLVYNDTIIVGILNSGPAGCSEHRVPAVYTSVLYYLSFIRDAINEKKVLNIRVATWTEIRPGEFEFVEN